MGFIDDDPQKKHLSVAGIDIYNQEEVLRGRIDDANLAPIRELWISSLQISQERAIDISRTLSERTGGKIAIRRFTMKIEEIS